MKNEPRPSNQLKKILLTAVILVVSITLPGCSFLNDKNSKVTEPRSMRMGDTACLSDTKKIMLDYLDGNESVERVEEVFTCLVKAVDSFTSKTKGQSSEAGYTLEEIQRFIIDYFADENSFSSRLLSIGFEIKSTAIGGRSNNITRVEIEKVKEILLSIKAGVHALDPHMDILLGRSISADNVPAEKIDQAVAALNTFVDQVSAKFDGNDGSPLAIQRIFDLVKTLRSASIDPDEEARTIKRLERFPILASNLKSILISGPKDRVHCNEWTAVLKTSAKMYGMMIRYKYGLADRSLGEGQTVKVTAGIISDLTSLLQQAVARNENHMIPSESIQELLINYEKVSGKLPLNIKSSSLATIYPKIFTNILRPSRISAFKNDPAAERNRPLGIGTIEVSALQYYMYNWLYGMSLSNTLFRNRDARTGADLSAELSDILKVTEATKAEGHTEILKRITRIVAIKEFLMVLDPTKRPLLYTRVNTPNQHARLDAPYIGGDSRDAQYRAEDLIRLNQTRIIVELVLRSFTVDTNRARTLDGLTTDEAEALYRDMRKVGFDLGAADPRSQRAGHRTFMEANLFMSNSDGNDYIKFREGIEWFNFVSASGSHALEIFNTAHEEWLKAAPANSPMLEDIFGRVKVDINSFRRHLKMNFGRYFSNLPGMASYVEQLKRQNKYEDFETSLENASRPLGHSNHRMDSSAMRTVVPIIYYTESIFIRYDKDKSGILENDEAWDIFPIMKNTINDVSNGAANTEWKQRMVFARLLLTGEPPLDDWRKYLNTPLDWLKEKWYKPSTDRLGIINLISAIATTSQANAIKSIKGMYEAKRGTIVNEFRSGSTVVLDQLHELSRCSPDSLEDFRKIMQKQSVFIFSPTQKPDEKGEEYTGDTFVRRLQLVIQSDRMTQRNGLHEQCQHMLRL